MKIIAGVIDVLILKIPSFYTPPLHQKPQYHVEQFSSRVCELILIAWLALLCPFLPVWQQ